MSPPPTVPDVVLSYPSPHVLLITLDRPKQLNALKRSMHASLDGLWTWFEGEASLRCAVITGRGRAFCAGADLKEWNERTATRDIMDDNGFGGLSNRRGKKPIIAAVNGLCLGGGMEMVLNADMVLASEVARFGLPEVKRGVVAIAGALPRLTRIVGRQRAAEIALLGRLYGARQMEAWGIVNRVVAEGQDVVEEALRWAAEVADNSPDSIIVSRAGLVGGWDAEDPRASTRRLEEVYSKVYGGGNMKEGLLSFVEKRKPVWRDSKL
ncbi:enoyl-hydratase [Stachybotrys elegans]|uniref:Enoyl-hydratase n=1 Tax=Stachybotrys elegans TaxID=80388 RepID=A0A8K0SXI7_9HYPO|nr:enoyl-hydratase [Stachybotrys elegans]